MKPEAPGLPLTISSRQWLQQDEVHALLDLELEADSDLQLRRPKELRLIQEPTVVHIDEWSRLRVALRVRFTAQAHVEIAGKFNSEQARKVGLTSQPVKGRCLCVVISQDLAFEAQLIWRPQPWDACKTVLSISNGSVTLKF